MRKLLKISVVIISIIVLSVVGSSVLHRISLGQMKVIQIKLEPAWANHMLVVLDALPIDNHAALLFYLRQIRDDIALYRKMNECGAINQMTHSEKYEELIAAHDRSVLLVCEDGLEKCHDYLGIGYKQSIHWNLSCEGIAEYNKFEELMFGTE